MTSGHRNKQKLDKNAHADLMFLTKGDLDEIGDKVCDTMTIGAVVYENTKKHAKGFV